MPRVRTSGRSPSPQIGADPITSAESPAQQAWHTVTLVTSGLPAPARRFVRAT
ncbi:hypothetical protein [Mobilicoccus caccae]|uniref:Uncharacterized protein n=1 Tax=Mobilicoccus caccae TaxID=1859295 RepID=A0ABQ6INW6_9MICO|nr:hypothetical protein [Mobilicoccus caccae]GMA38414.1 hypothetical protein GCM10025883_04590 [Mobilicoccus caccae]